MTGKDKGYALIMWLCGWALIVEGLCSIFTLGAWNPVVEGRFYLWLMDIKCLNR